MVDIQIEELKEHHKIESMSQSWRGIGLVLLGSLAGGFYELKIATGMASSLGITGKFSLLLFKTTIVVASKHLQ